MKKQEKLHLSSGECTLAMNVINGQGSKCPLPPTHTHTHRHGVYKYGQESGWKTYIEYRLHIITHTLHSMGIAKKNGAT